MWTQDELSNESAVKGPNPGAANAPQSGSAILGQSVVITGELKATEDLTVEGHLDGKIELRQNSLTIGQNATTEGEIFAQEVVVLGNVTGNISASKKVEIWPNGSVQGDIVSPTVTIAEGATFRGAIDMPSKEVETPARPETPTPAIDVAAVLTPASPRSASRSTTKAA